MDTFEPCFLSKKTRLFGSFRGGDYYIKQQVTYSLDAEEPHNKVPFHEDETRRIGKDIS